MAQSLTVSQLELHGQSGAKTGALRRQPAQVVQRAGVDQQRTVIAACLALPGACPWLHMRLPKMPPLQVAHNVFYSQHSKRI